MKVDICIPTKNRLPYIKDTIKYWTHAITKYSLSGFRVCVADGGSSDGTVDWLEKQNNIITIYRGENDYGKRLANFIVKSDSDWIWYFGDDDLIVPENLPYVINYLENFSGGVLFVNYSVWNKCFSDCECPNAFDNSRVMQCGWSGLGQRLGFLSMLIIRRDLACKPPILEWSKISAAWPHVPLIFFLAEKYGFCVIKKIVVQQRGGNSLFGAQPGEWYRPFVLEWNNVCSFGFQLGISEKTIRILRNAPFYEKNLGFRRILGDKLKGAAPSANDIKKMLSFYWKEPNFLFCILIPWIIPKTFWVLVRSLYRFFSKHNSF